MGIRGVAGEKPGMPERRIVEKWCPLRSLRVFTKKSTHPQLEGSGGK